YIQFLRVCI
ncbi:hypothetical protein ACTFIW_000055, partial [Dictyostelium discoideum]